MSLSSNLINEIRQVIEKIQLGTSAAECVPKVWKLDKNRQALDDAFHDVCVKMWAEMGDTALNRSGYSNSISSFWDEIIGRKKEKSHEDVEHLDETWYF